MVKKGVYQSPSMMALEVGKEDVIRTSGDASSGGSSGGGTIVPPISNGGDFNGEDY